jgi:hypothetical protein
MKLDPGNHSSPRPERAHGPATPRPEPVSSPSLLHADMWAPHVIPLLPLIPPPLSLVTGNGQSYSPS